MNKKQTFTTMLAVILIAATIIFAGCNKYKAEVTGVSVCPNAEMLTVGKNTIVSELLTYTPETGLPDYTVTWTSSKPNIATVDGMGIVNAYAVGESVITCVTKDGGFSASATIIVNPVEIDDDFATNVPDFYFGNTKRNDETVDINKLITVKYHSRNKIIYSIDETFKLARTGSTEEISLKADIVADITKDGSDYKAVCEVPLTMGKASASTTLYLDGTFDGSNLDLIITFKNLPDMEEDVTLNFKARGTYKIDC